MIAADNVMGIYTIEKAAYTCAEFDNSPCRGNRTELLN